MQKVFKIFILIKKYFYLFITIPIIFLFITILFMNPVDLIPKAFRTAAALL
jgi:hypothetical protein